MRKAIRHAHKNAPGSKPETGMERARGREFAQGNPQTRDIPVTQGPEVAVDMAAAAVPDANPIPPDGRSGGKGGG